MDPLLSDSWHPFARDVEMTAPSSRTARRGGLAMNAVAARTFQGFTPEAIQFLADLAANNDRAWFQPRKSEFERLLKEPLAALCADLAEICNARDLPLRADPVRSPYRIYRDIRFTRDKSPYKTHLGATFPWVEDGEANRATPGGYFHLAPGEIFVGGGMWHPEPARLAAFRRLVVGDPTAVSAALDDPPFVEWYGTVNGDTLKRVPTGYPADHPRADLLRLKDVVFGHRLSDADAFSPRLPDLLGDAFAAAVPVFRLLARLDAS